MIYLTLAEALWVAERAIGELPKVRDHGLLDSALARPAATVFGQDAYPTLGEKAAALMHSLAGNHALVDGNKRLALGCTLAFLGMNGQRLLLTNDEAYHLVMDVARGRADVPQIAARLRLGPRPPRQRSAR